MYWQQKQLIQCFKSTSALPLDISIALAGQLFAQTPQETHISYLKTRLSPTSTLQPNFLKYLTKAATAVGWVVTASSGKFS